MKVALPFLLLVLAASCTEQGSVAAAEQEQLTFGAVPTGPVADRADIIPADAEAALDRQLRAFEDETSNALIVLTVDSLQGQSVETVAFETFNSWGIGGSKTDRGLLILVAPNERSVRIEVGCGLESVITNERAQTIIDDVMLPRYRENDLSSGTVNGAQALMEATGTYAADAANGPVSEICKNELAKAA